MVTNDRIIFTLHPFFIIPGTQSLYYTEIFQCYKYRPEEVAVQSLALDSAGPATSVTSLSLGQGLYQVNHMGRRRRMVVSLPSHLPKDGHHRTFLVNVDIQSFKKCKPNNCSYISFYKGKLYNKLSGIQQYMQFLLVQY